MDFFEVVKKRRSIRSYTGEAIPRENLEKIIDAGRLAASGRNRQPWAFVVVTKPELIEAISNLMNPGLQGSGAFVAVVVDPTDYYHVQDASAAIENILLAAAALGYGSCWLEGNTSRYEDALKTILNIPGTLKLQTMVSIGVANQQSEPDKKALDEVLHWEQY